MFKIYAFNEDTCRGEKIDTADNAAQAVDYVAEYVEAFGPGWSFLVIGPDVVLKL